MRVKIGETATASLTVDVRYRCSVCGVDNLTMQTIKALAHTSTVFGINLNSSLHQTAKNNLIKTLTSILDVNNPQRFRQAGFKCRCTNCGHIEPWAKMNYERLENLKVLSVVLMVLSGMLLLARLNVRHFDGGLVFSL